MLKFLPILLPLAYALLIYRFSVKNTLRELDEKSTELVDPKFQPVLDRLAKALDLPRVRVHLYEIEPVNGLAAPDGRIFITRGFYEKFRSGEVSAEELGSVIAHEMGHVALGHSRRRMIDFTGQNAMRMALGAIFNRFIPGVGYWLANMATSLLAARLSRSDEYEADEYAAALLTKAGIGVAPQVSLFEKLEELSGNVAGRQPAWLLSHPKTGERIAAIQGLENRWKRS